MVVPFQIRASEVVPLQAKDASTRPEHGRGELPGRFAKMVLPALVDTQEGRVAYEALCRWYDETKDPGQMFVVLLLAEPRVGVQAARAVLKAIGKGTKWKPSQSAERALETVDGWLDGTIETSKVKRPSYGSNWDLDAAADRLRTMIVDAHPEPGSYMTAAWSVPHNVNGFIPDLVYAFSDSFRMQPLSEAWQTTYNRDAALVADMVRAAATCPDVTKVLDAYRV